MFLLDKFPLGLGCLLLSIFPHFAPSDYRLGQRLSPHIVLDHEFSQQVLDSFETVASGPHYFLQLCPLGPFEHQLQYLLDHCRFWQLAVVFGVDGPVLADPHLHHPLLSHADGVKSGPLDVVVLVQVLVPLQNVQQEVDAFVGGKTRVVLVLLVFVQRGPLINLKVG